jgi:hypothetical protein
MEIPSEIVHGDQVMVLSEPSQLKFNRVHVFLGAKASGKTYLALKNVEILSGDAHRTISFVHLCYQRRRSNTAPISLPNVCKGAPTR